MGVSQSVPTEIKYGAQRLHKYYSPVVNLKHSIQKSGHEYKSGLVSGWRFGWNFWETKTYPCVHLGHRKLSGKSQSIAWSVVNGK